MGREGEGKTEGGEKVGKEEGRLDCGYLSRCSRVHCYATAIRPLHTECSDTSQLNLPHETNNQQESSDVADGPRDAPRRAKSARNALSVIAIKWPTLTPL